jgi:uncharacterized protein (TIGR03000 family)
MYGVVLMAALATSAPAPGFHHRCHGCSGYSSGCHGCYGYAGCHGCYGSYGCYGCYGSAWGGPWAGAYTGWNYGAFYCTGCYGCYGGYSCYGSPYAGPGGPTYVSPGLTWPNNPVRPPLEVTPTPKVKGPEEARARVRIEIPADAKLYVDGVLMKTTSDVRLFQTPELKQGQTYVYELKAELLRNNEKFTETQKLIVRPGEHFSASFGGLEQRAAAAASNSQAAQR